MATVTFNALTNAKDIVPDAGIVTNGAGTVITSTTTGAYYSNTFALNDALTIERPTAFRNVEFDVGTAVAATSVTFAWEYQNTGGGAWVALTVDNPNALTKTGVQLVSFTPPVDWVPANDANFKIRCRISAVTSPTSGGAQTTNYIQIGDNALTVTGTSATSHNVYTSDLAGTYDLIPSQAIASSYTPIEMPVNQIDGGSSKVSIVTASGTYSSASVSITGTDVAGTSQTETISITADGTVASTKAYKNITSVTTTGISGGSCTLRMYQNRWGVVQEKSNSGNMLEYDWHATLRIGDGSTTTSYDSSYELWRFWSGVNPMVRISGTWTCGNTFSGANFSRGRSGHVIELNWNYQQLGTNNSSSPSFCYGGTCTWYGAKVGFYTNTFGANLALVTQAGSTQGVINYTDCLIEVSNGSGQYAPQFNINTPGTCTWTRVRWVGGQMSVVNIASMTFTNCELDCSLVAQNVPSFTMSGTPIDKLYMQVASSTVTYTFNDSGITASNVTLTYNSPADSQGVLINNSYGAHVQTSGGTAVNAARMKIIDNTSTLVASATTNSSGNIPTQTIRYQGLGWTNGGSLTATTYSPHQIKLMEYAYNFVTLTKTLSSANASVAQDTFLAITDANALLTETAANALTGISINWATSTITITANQTLNDLYCYCKAQNILNPTYAQPITTVDGNNYTSTFNIVCTGAVLSGTTGQGLNMSAGSITLNTTGDVQTSISDATIIFTAAGGTYSQTYNALTFNFNNSGTFDFRSATLTGTTTLEDTVTSTVTAQFAPGPTINNTDPTHITVTNSTAVTIAVTNLVIGSQVRILDGGGVEILNATASGTSVSVNYTFTSNFTATYLVRYASSSTRYLEYSGSIAVTSTGGSGIANQIVDSNNTHTIPTPTNWSINYSTKVISATTGATILKTGELYAYLMDQLMSSGNMQYSNAMNCNVLDSEYTLINGYTLSANTEQFLTTGGISTSDGNNIYTNVQSLGAGSRTIYLEQNGSALTSWWTSGNINVLIKVKSGGSLIDSGNLHLFTRDFNYIYSDFIFSASAGGVSYQAVSSGTDTNNQTASGTVSGWSTAIVLTWGTVSKDLGDGTGAHNYDLIVDAGGHAVKDVYEYLKYITEKGNTTLLPPTTGVQGQLYTSVNPATYAIDNNGPFGTFAGSKFFGAQGIWLQNMASSDTLNYQLTDSAGGVHNPPPSITVTGLISGSRVYIEDTTTSTVLNNSIVSGTTFSMVYTGTIGDAISGKVAYVSGTSAYQPVLFTGTVSSTGFSLNVTQVADTTYNNNAIDGSTLTEFSITGTTIEIYVNQTSGADTIPKSYNWWVYTNFTATGIANQTQSNFTATDTAHYTFANGQKYKNITSPSVPLVFTGAEVVDTSGSVSTCVDTTGGNIYILPKSVEPYNTGGGSSTSSFTVGDFLALK